MADPRLLMMVIAAIGLVYVVAPIALGAYFRYRRPRTVACPETGLAEEVRIDAWHAAATAVPGPIRLAIDDCSRWPERAGCRQRCLASPSLK